MRQQERTCSRETREDLIDSLIAMSLLTRRMARSLIGMNTNTATTAKKGERTYGKDERTGRPAYRVVRA